MSEPLTTEQIEELERLEKEAWCAPWVPHTFEIECPCPNGEDCGDTHSCEEVEAPEAYPDSPEDPAEPGEGQCVVQISVPGLESLSRPTARFIAALRNAAPSLLASARAHASALARAEAAERERDEARAEAQTNRAKYEGALGAIPVVVAKEKARLMEAAERDLAAARAERDGARQAALERAATVDGLLSVESRLRDRCADLRGALRECVDVLSAMFAGRRKSDVPTAVAAAEDRARALLAPPKETTPDARTGNGEGR